MSKPFSIGQRVQIVKGSRKGQIGYVVIVEKNVAPNHCWDNPQWVTVESSYRVALDMANPILPQRYLTCFDGELVNAE